MSHLKRLLLRGLCGGLRPSNFHKTTLVAAITLTIRPVMSADFSDKLMSIYLLNVLSIPALTLHLKQSSPDSLNMLQKNRIVARSVELLSQEQQLKIHFNALEGSYALCLTANLVHMVSQMTEEQFAEVDLIKLLFVITRLMESCGQVSLKVLPSVKPKSWTRNKNRVIHFQYVTAKQSNLSHWHPVLGWFSVSLDAFLQDSMERVRTQLSRLWSPHCVRLFSAPLTEIVSRLPEVPSIPDAAASLHAPPTSTGPKNMLKKALERTKAAAAATSSTVVITTSASSSHHTKLGSPECMKVALICSMYQHALKTLSQLKLEILSGLCYQNLLLLPLW